MIKRLFIVVSLLAATMSVSAQELWMDGSKANIPDHISVKEISTMSHTTAEDGSPVVNIVKHNGTEYSFSPEDIKDVDVKTAWDAFLQDERYQDMRVVRDPRYFDTMEDGDLVGIFNVHDYSTEEFATVAYPDEFGLDTIMPKFLKLNNVELLAKYAVRKANIHYRSLGIAYVSTDYNGDKIILTGNLLYPYCVGRKDLACSHIYVDNHMTIINNRKAPSENLSTGALMQGIVSKGYFVVQPDLFGIGASMTRTQQYVDRKHNPKNIVDCLLAAQQYQEMSNDTDAPLVMSNDVKMINSGGSQGATSALATTYYIENVMDQELRKKLPPIMETRLCGGAYDMKLTLNEYCRANKVVFSAIVPLLMQGVFAAHHSELLDENGNQYSLHDFFSPMMRDFTMDTSEMGLPGEHTVWQMLDSKCLESASVIQALTIACGVLDPSIAMLGCYTPTNRLLNSDLLKENGMGGYMLNEDHPKVKAFAKILEDNDLTNPEMWIPQSDIKMVHGVDDYMVPFANSRQLFENMHSKMQENGHVIDFETIDEIDPIGNHIVFCMAWVVAEVSGLDLKVVLKMM